MSELNRGKARELKQAYVAHEFNAGYLNQTVKVAWYLSA